MTLDDYFRQRMLLLEDERNLQDNPPHVAARIFIRKNLVASIRCAVTEARAGDSFSSTLRLDLIERAARSYKLEVDPSCSCGECESSAGFFGGVS